MFIDTPNGKEGWKFDGWDISVPDFVTGDITFSARWIAQDETVNESIKPSCTILIHAIYLTIIILLVILAVALIIKIKIKK